MNKKVYYEIAMYRGNCRITEIGTDRDRIMGYKGYLLKTRGTIFKESSLHDGKLESKDLKKIRRLVTGDNFISFSKARQILKKLGATHCYWCDRTIDECKNYNNCEKHNRLKSAEQQQWTSFTRRVF